LFDDTMLTRDGEEKRHYANRHRQRRRVDHSDRWRQLQEGILEEPLQLKSKEYLYAKHLHSQFIERRLQRRFKRRHASPSEASQSREDARIGPRAHREVNPRLF
jgi:hypothetical protein